jgi:hypothetical protein
MAVSRVICSGQKPRQKGWVFKRSTFMDTSTWRCFSTPIYSDLF